MTAHDDAMPEDLTDEEALHWERFEDPEPQPSEGPDYHADHAAWRTRQEESQ